MSKKPAIVAHCDWSIDPKHRWMAVARRHGSEWLIERSEPVGDVDTLFQKLGRRRRKPGAILLGVDFPIGFPRFYGRQTGFSDVLEAFKSLGHGEWSHWFDVCDEPHEISVKRPFYPRKVKAKGEIKKQHLLERLGAATESDLLRACERVTGERQAACSIFWTLGANQVGKAAIAGLRELIVPNLGKIALWPFHGGFSDLVTQSDVVVCETYPAEAYNHLGIERSSRWSKQSRADRATKSHHVIAWCEKRPIDLSDGVLSDIEAGFSAEDVGADQFDACVGLCSMLDVVDGLRSEGATTATDVKQWEGWILGQSH